MELEANKELIRRWLAFADDGFSGHFDTFIVPEYVGHLSSTDKTMDRTELERLERQFTAAFSGTRRMVKDLLAEADKVVLRIETLTTHTGEFYGIPPTNKEVRFTGIVIYRIAGGRIAESWAEIDFAGLIRNLRAS
jgi:predicted ester cyclase